MTYSSRKPTAEVLPGKDNNLFVTSDIVGNSSPVSSVQNAAAYGSYIFEYLLRWTEVDAVASTRNSHAQWVLGLMSLMLRIFRHEIAQVRMLRQIITDATPAMCCRLPNRNKMFILVGTFFCYRSFLLLGQVLWIH